MVRGANKMKKKQNNVGSAVGAILGLVWSTTIIAASLGLMIVAVQWAWGLIV